MSEVDRARCRRAAAEYVDLARIATDPNTKQILLIRAQEWLKLAYSDHDAEFVALLAEFNTRQMSAAPRRSRRNSRTSSSRSSSNSNEVPRPTGSRHSPPAFHSSPVHLNDSKHAPGGTLLPRGHHVKDAAVRPRVGRSEADTLPEMRSADAAHLGRTAPSVHQPRRSPFRLRLRRHDQRHRAARVSPRAGLRPRDTARVRPFRHTTAGL